MKRVWVIALAVAHVCAAPLPTVDEIIRKSVANTRADWSIAPQYDFTERDVISGQRKTYQVMMIDESPYQELVAVNGQPLGPAQKQAEDRKLQLERERREHEMPGERARRVAAYTRERRQDDALLAQMIQAMDFKVTGEDTVDGRRCFVLQGTPKPGYQPTSRDTKVLKGMRGTLWIDEQAYQWVKVKAQVFRPVAFGLFVAHVEPGTEFELEQQPVNGSLWLPSHFSMHVNAQIMGVWRHRSSDDETYSSYRPSSQSSIAGVASRVR